MLGYFPKSTRYKKVFNFKTKSFIKPSATYSTSYTVVSHSYGLITSRQLEALRRFISRRLPPKTKLYRRFSLQKSITRKSLKSRMGKGVGGFYGWVGFLRPGVVLFEFSSLYLLGLEFRRISTKFPFKCAVVALACSYV